MFSAVIAFVSVVVGFLIGYLVRGYRDGRIIDRFLQNVAEETEAASLQFR